MRVFGICSYPVEAAATRYRLQQFVEPLREQGVHLSISPFLSSELFKMQYAPGSTVSKAVRLAGAVFRRAFDLSVFRGQDILYVQREAMIFGPAVFEWIYQKIGRLPLVLDLDDATYLVYDSPTYGKLGRFLKFFGKTDRLIKRADVVVCGNRFIAEYVESKGARSVVIPTVVDTALFSPVERKNDVPVIGWIGTHSTFPMLRSIIPVLEKLAEKHDFVLRIIGSGLETIESKGLTIENLRWELAREVSDFQNLDIGLYPVFPAPNAPKEWNLGKSGFKAIQYLAVGVPFVMSPVGICAEIGIDGETHFNAGNDSDWFDALDRLLSSEALRIEMGAKGRNFSLRNFAVEAQTAKLIETFRSVLR